MPEGLLGTEFDPESDQLVQLRYADYPVAVLETKALRPTATLRFGARLTLVGPKQAMQSLHGLWAEDQRFDRSFDDRWA